MPLHFTEGIDSLFHFARGFCFAVQSTCREQRDELSGGFLNRTETAACEFIDACRSAKQQELITLALTH